jgi:hypothetical protein
MLSRNSASSRAIPFKKMLEMVKENPFIPIKWMRDHKGMQGNQFFSGFKVWLFKRVWLFARTMAVIMAWTLSKMGLTKQIVNRLLEPFMWHTVIATGTEWENFFALRAHDQAEIHIQELAHKMLEEYNKSAPKQLVAGDWHIPFSDKLDNHERIVKAIKKIENRTEVVTDFEIDITQIKIATARCARVSYLNFEGKDDYEADIRLHDNLAASGHWSPFEHCARAMSEEEFQAYGITFPREKDNPGYFIDVSEGWCGNFRGFIQYRKMFDNENRKDIRVISK